MVAGGGFTFYTCDDGEVFPKGRHEKFITVRNDLGRETVFTIPVFKEEDGTAFRGQGGLCWDDAHIRVEAVCNG